jgi:hypothetical protein
MPPPLSTHLSAIEVDWRETGTMGTDARVPDTAVVRDECIVSRPVVLGVVALNRVTQEQRSRRKSRASTPPKSSTS